MPKRLDRPMPKPVNSYLQLADNLVCFFFLPKPFPKQALVFTCPHYKTFENTVGKGEIARNEQFLLFPHCFLSVCRTFFHFYQISNCRLQTLSVWKSPKFVVWERVNIQYQVSPFQRISSG